MADAEHKDVWTGTYRGVNYEIAFWGKRDGSRSGINEGRGMWNYYILINQDMLSEEEFAKVWLPVDRWLDRSSGRKMPCYNEYRSILNHGDFHGGITHYSKHQCPDEGYRWIKAGCDYGHLWRLATLAWVEQDAKRTIDKLHEVFRFKYRCQYMGTYDYPENMVEVRPGVLYSKEGVEKDAAWQAKREAEKTNAA